MKIGIVDADLVGRAHHKFPNLACMKLSKHWKRKDAAVELLMNYNNLDAYDQVLISKVFEDTPVPKGVVERENVNHGGTGFFYDKAEALTQEIELIMPDYNLYRPWVKQQLSSGTNPNQRKYYIDFSIGLTTRGCFRKCEFCVNKRYSKVFRNSRVRSFVHPKLPYICLLDDNVLGFKEWEVVFEELQAMDTPFQFKQGMDVRLMNEKKAFVLSKSRYIGEFIFAFDETKDEKHVIKGLKTWHHFNHRICKLYVLCGWNGTDEQDIADAFYRISKILEFGDLPFLMKYVAYQKSKWADLYRALSSWCNTPGCFKKKSFREMCTEVDTHRRPIMEKFEAAHPQIARDYFDLKWKRVNWKRSKIFE